MNHSKLILFEGFRPNGLQIRILRIILHRIAPVKIDFDDLGDFSYFLSFLPSLKPSKLIIIELLGGWEYAKTTSHGQNLLGAYIKAYFGRKMTTTTAHKRIQAENSSLKP